MGKKQKRFWINETQICGTGCCQGHDATILEKFGKTEAFASYAFNKSLYLLCFAYQTAYLKAHYPAEYMQYYRII
jgi:DNA polymerase III alpha subunit